jgi:hypothetical protein
LKAFAKAAEPFFNADQLRMSKGDSSDDDDNGDVKLRPDEIVLRQALRFYLMFANADKAKRALSPSEFHALSLVDDLLFRALLRKQVCFDCYFDCLFLDSRWRL